MPTYCAISFSSFNSSEMHVASIYIDFRTPEYLLSKQKNESHEYFEEYSSFLEINTSNYYSSEISYVKIDKRIDSLLEACKTLKSFFILISEKDYKAGFESSAGLFSKEQLLFIKESIEYRNVIDYLKARMHITKFINNRSTEYKLRNALVVYLELNGANLKISSGHERPEEISRNEKTEEDGGGMILGAGVLRDFMIFDGDGSLFGIVDRTSTKNCQLKLRSETASPLKSKTSICKRREFLRSFQNTAFVGEIQKMLKNIKPYQPVRTEIEDPHSSIILGKSQNEKSIYSRKSLDEVSISSYKSLIRKTANLFANVLTFERISNYLKHQFEEMHAPREVKDLLRTLNSIEIREIRGILSESISQNYNCKGLLDDEFSLVVKSKLDDYLDLSRSIYFKRLKECQQLVLKIIENTEMEIHRTEKHETCIKQAKNTLNLKKVQESLESGKSTIDPSKKKARILQDITNKNRSTVNASKKSKLDSTCLTENITSTKSRSQKNRIKSNEKTKLHVDKIKANGSCIYRIKTTKNYYLYTNNKIKSLNEIVKDSLYQIIEIQGKICKSVLLRLERYGDFLNQVFNEISELDICIGMIISASDWHRKQRIDTFNRWPMSNHDNITALEGFVVRNVSNLLIKDSTKTDYGFSKNNVKLITGPNMSGKTAYLRNVAHLVILNQIGCPIPCEYLKIPIFDEMYYISTINDIVELDYNLRTRSCLAKPKYKTPKILVLIDELQCSIKIQITLIRVLERAKILSLFVSHNLKMIEYCRREKYELYTFEDFRMKEGVNKLKNCFEICKNILPDEIIEKMKKKAYSMPRF